MLSNSISVSRWKRLAQVVVEVREHVRRPAEWPRTLRRYSHWPAKLLPSARARSSFSIRRTCCSSTAGSCSRPCVGQRQQLVVRNAAPDEERQARRQLEIADRGRSVPGATFAGSRSTRNRNRGFTSMKRQRRLDAGVEAAALRRAPRRRSRPAAAFPRRSAARDRRGAPAWSGSFARTPRPAPAAGSARRRSCGGSARRRVPPALNGPSTVTLSSSGMPTGVIGSMRSRSNGCSSSSVVARALLEERHADRVRARA